MGFASTRSSPMDNRARRGLDLISLTGTRVGRLLGRTCLPGRPISRAAVVSARHLARRRYPLAPGRKLATRVVPAGLVAVLSLPPELALAVN